MEEVGLDGAEISYVVLYFTKYFFGFVSVTLRHVHVGLYETGAGGSAPKHVQQFVKEGHLRWDSLGEYLATGKSSFLLYHATSELTYFDELLPLLSILLIFRAYITLEITAAAFCQLGGPPSNNPKAEMLGECLNKAVGRILNNRKSPSRRVKEIDNRATNFYVRTMLNNNTKMCALLLPLPKTYKLSSLPHIIGLSILGKCWLL